MIFAFRYFITGNDTTAKIVKDYVVVFVMDGVIMQVNHFLYLEPLQGPTVQANSRRRVQQR